MIVKMFAAIKNKALYIALVALATLLLALYIDHGSLIEERDKVKKDLTVMAVANERLVAENKNLQQQLKKTPNESIVITKESIKELCAAQTKAEAIKALPSKRTEVKKDEKTSNPESGVADIDDRLPDELLRLLQ